MCVCKCLIYALWISFSKRKRFIRKEKRNYLDHVIKTLIMIKHALFDDDHHCDDSDALLKIF